jgi:protein TonB
MEALGGNGTVNNVFNGQGQPRVRAVAGKLTVSAGVAVGLLVHKTQPTYPPIAKAARVSGTVVLQGTISKTGSLETLRVVSGPPMLRQAALEAVQTWRYRPYMLSNVPTEVDTTVNVVFALGG